MKSIYLVSLVLILGTTGCYTPPHYAEQARGHGTKQTFAAPYGAVWAAAVDAAQKGDLGIVSADRASGYIHARRIVQPHTSGEDVAVWVTSLSPTATGVEVSSHQAGPPQFWLKNWEHDILNGIAANLTREIPTATGAAGTTSSTTTGAGNSITVNVPPSPTSPASVVVTPSPVVTLPPATTKTTTDLIAEQQRHLDELRRQEDLRLKELERERDVTRRDTISAEIERLRGELRSIADRMADLELEQKRLK